MKPEKRANPFADFRLPFTLLAEDSGMISAKILRFRRWWILGAVMATATLRALSAETPDQTRLAIGQKTPPFTLKARDEKERSLESVLKKGKTILVFHRSADW